MSQPVTLLHERTGLTIRARETSPQVYARIGGILYLLIAAGGVFAEAFVRGRLIVRGDAAATAANILQSETLFRAGLAAETFMLVCDVAVAAILYVLLNPVNRNLALIAAFLRVTHAGVYGFTGILHLAAVIVLGRDEFLQAFDSQQLHALAYLSLRLHGYGYSVSLVFFGCSLVILGHLIYRSDYLPRMLGVLLMIAGMCYLTNSFAHILAPAVAASLFPWILLPAVPAEMGLSLWLIVKGVNLAKWQETVLKKFSDQLPTAR
jgi:general stress protein CsbA